MGGGSDATRVDDGGGSDVASIPPPSLRPRHSDNEHGDHAVSVRIARTSRHVASRSMYSENARSEQMTRSRIAHAQPISGPFSE